MSWLSLRVTVNPCSDVSRPYIRLFLYFLDSNNMILMVRAHDTSRWILLDNLGELSHSRSIPISLNKHLAEDYRIESAKLHFGELTFDGFSNNLEVSLH